MPSTKKSSAKTAVVKKAVPKKSSIKTAVVKKAVSKKAIAKPAVVKKAVSKKAIAKPAVVKKAVSKKAIAKPAVVKKAAPAKVVVKKAVPKKAAVNKIIPKKAESRILAVKKTAPKKATSKKAVVKKVAQKTPAKALSATKGDRVEELITQRSVDLKSVEELMGVQEFNREKKPIIPGIFDLIIPPGTPRKIVLKMAKQYNLDVIRRDDIYVPIGVSDVERDLLVFRGDMKTVNKLEKILLKELEDYEKTGKVEGFKVIP